MWPRRFSLCGASLFADPFGPARGLPDPLSAPLTIAPETLAAVRAATGAQDAEEPKSKSPEAVP